MSKLKKIAIRYVRTDGLTPIIEKLLFKNLVSKYIMQEVVMNLRNISKLDLNPDIDKAQHFTLAFKYITIISF